MFYKLALASAVFASAVMIMAPRTSALADIIDLSPPPSAFLGSNYEQDIVVNNRTVIINILGSGAAYGNWFAVGQPQFNADGSTADLFMTTPGGSTIRAIGLHPQEGLLFNFTSIGLASSLNDRTGGDIVFTFSHADGTIDSTIVSLHPGRTGLQTFTFDEQNLITVGFLPISTEGNLLQFDDLGITLLGPPPSSVPAPIVGAGLPGAILASVGVRLVIPDHALGSPVLRTLSLCTCCRHYPGAAVGRTASLIHPTVSAFPESYATSRPYHDLACPTGPKAIVGRKRQFPELSNRAPGTVSV